MTAAPFTLVAAVEPAGVRLSWNDPSSREVEYRVQRSRKVGAVWSDWSRIARLGPNVTTHLDADPGAGQFRYRVRLLWPGGADRYSTLALATVGPPPLSDLAQQIADLTNAERARVGVKALAVNLKLVRAAQHHAENMARYGTMAHTLPAADTPTLVDRMAWCGYEWSMCAENISYDTDDPAHTMQEWMRSPGHKTNILDRRLVDLGVGVAPGQGQHAGRWFYDQTFGRPE